MEDCCSAACAPRGGQEKGSFLPDDKKKEGFQMRNWKKRAAAAFLMAVMAVCVVADVTPASAAALTAKQYLAKMEKASAKAKSYEVTQTTTVVGSQAGQSQSAKTTTKQTVFQKPVQAKNVTTVTVKGAGVSQNSKSVVYIREDSKGKIYEYISTDGSAYEEMDVTDLYSSASDLDTSLYSGAKIVKKSVKVNKIDTVQISTKVAGADMADALAALGMGDDQIKELGIDFGSLAPIEVTIWIDKKTYLPVKVTTDMKAFYNSFFKSMYAAMDAESDVSYSVAKSTTTYKNFNKAAKFKFPKF